MSKKTNIKAPVVVGDGSCQVLVVAEIPLDPPAFEIYSITKKVNVEQCHAVHDRVIINGTLNKNITYKTLTDTDTFNGNTRYCGEIRHCMVQIPFHCFADIPGAMENNNCQVERAEVIGETEQLQDSRDDCSTSETLLEKAIILVEVKVTRTEQLPVEEEECEKEEDKEETGEEECECEDNEENDKYSFDEDEEDEEEDSNDDDDLPC